MGQMPCKTAVIIFFIIIVVIMIVIAVGALAGGTTPVSVTSSHPPLAYNLAVEGDAARPQSFSDEKEGRANQQEVVFAR